MKIEYIPLLEDNYCYLIINQKKGMLVDPAVAQPVIDYLSKQYPEITITHILATHKHWDHVGEVDDLIEKLQDFNANKSNSKIEVISGLQDKIPSSTILIDKLIKFKVNDLEMTIFCAPCHTKGHLLYQLENVEQQKSNVQDQLFHKALFTGDTLFYGGCGRFFEGNAKEMLNNFDIIENLQDDVFIFAGHEYTVQNLQWASQVEFDNEDLQKKLQWAIKQREQKLPTVPSTVADEKITNIFMRTRNKNIQEKLQLSNPEEIMSKLREMKNNNITLK